METETPGSEAETFLRNLHMIRTMVGRVLEQEPLERSSEDQLTFPQVNLLKLVARAVPDRGRGQPKEWLVTEISRYLHVSLPAASQAVRRLEAEGWLTVRPDAEDSRRRRVGLTPKARGAVRRNERAEQRLLSELLEPVGAKALRAWNRRLEEILARFLHVSAEPPCLLCGMYAGGNCIARREGFECPVRGPA